MTFFYLWSFSDAIYSLEISSSEVSFCENVLRFLDLAVCFLKIISLSLSLSLSSALDEIEIVVVVVVPPSHLLSAVYVQGGPMAFAAPLQGWREMLPISVVLPAQGVGQREVQLQLR